MANNGNLTFLVKFDLNGAVKEASGDIDKVLREMQARINAKPPTIKPKVDDAALKDMSDRLANLSIPQAYMGKGKNRFSAAEGSINALSAAMQKCIKEWNNLSESERIVNRESGEYTAKAQAIISRFAELTAASNTFAKSLQEIARESKTAADAEMKRNQKAAEQVAVLRSQERTLDQVNNKIKLLTQIMRGLDKNDPIWKTLAGNLERVRQKQTELQAAQKAELAQIQGEYNAIKQLISSLQGYGNTIGQIQAKLAAFKSTLNNTTVGGAAFREAALQIKMMNEELQRANQLVQNYQAKSLQGVGKKNTDAAVRQMEQYQQRIQQIDAQMNLAHAKGQDMGSQQMIKLLQERIALEEKLKNAMTTGADAAKQKLDAEIKARTKEIRLAQESQRQAEAERRRIRDLNAEKERANAAITGTKNYTAPLASGIDVVRRKYQELVAQLNSTAQRRYNIKVQIDKLFEADIKRITADINNLGQQMAKVGSSGGNVKPYLDAINQLRAELDRIKNDKIQLFNMDDVQKEFAAIQTKTAEMFAKLTGYERRYAADTAFNQAADKRIAEIKRIEGEIAKLENEFRRMQTMGTAYNTNGNLSKNAESNLRQQIALTQQLEKATMSNEQERQRVQQSIQKWEEMRKVISSNETTMGALTAKLQLYQDRLSRLDVGTEKFAKTAMEITRLQTELQKASQYAQDFAQKAFQGLSATDTSKRVADLQMWRQRLQQVEEGYNRLRNSTMQNGSNTAANAQLNALLQQRMEIVRNIDQITKTAEQAQVEREKEINRIIESRNAKQKAHNDAIAKAVQARKQERTMLMANERTIDNVTKKLQHWQTKLNSTDMRSGQFNQIAQEVQRLTAKLERMKQKMAEATGQTEQGANRQKSAVDKASESFRKQETYVSRLLKRLAVYASFSAVGNFLTKVREVTAQFELQRISLGAILQDQAKANRLFSEIKSFALKSPVKILDLTKYTKQLAAYKIGYDELFETTKRLTDVSVGLGVSMDRIVLLFGQIRATGYLRASEVRQATEAGIPLVEELAAKLTEANGKLVTSADVMEMISKRAISFDMVKEVFEDMTDKGGVFYNMQEKQGNTLYGMWAKLGDAVSIMYDEIGNTSVVNAGMKSVIQILTDLMKNWRDVARIATEAGAAFAVYKLAVIASTKATALATVWEKKDIVLRQMQLKTVMAQSIYVRNFNRVLLASGVSAQKAATATWVFSKALHGLKSAIASTGIGVLLIGLGLLVDRLLFSKSTAEQLKESLDDIETESIQEQDKSVRNFERLANIAVSASSTYKEQQAALEELKRTYKEIIPQEQLTIENLKQMNGNYELLTASIRRYVAERMKQKQADEIINTYASEILKIQRNINNQLKNKYSAEQLEAFWVKYSEIVKDSSKSAGKSVSELVNMTASAIGADLQFAHDIGSVWTLFAHDHVDVSRMTTLIREQERQLDALSKTYDSASMAMGEYAKSYSEAVDKISQDGVKLKGKVIEKEDNPLLYSQQEANLEIKDAMIPTIKEAFNAAGIAFDDGWTSLIDNVDENMPQLTSSINFDPMIEKTKEESQKLLTELQKQLDALAAQREAYLKQIQAEEAKGKDGNDEVIQNAKNRYNEIGDEMEKLEERARKINILLPLLEHLKKKYEDFAPSDPVVKLMRQRFDSIVDYTKAYAKNMRRFRMNADEDMEAYRKRLSDEVELIKKNIKAWTAAMILARLFRNKTEEQNLQNLIDEAKLQLKDLEKILGDMPVFDKSKSRGGTKSDPRLQTLQEIANKMAEVNKEYDELLKKEGKTKALADTQKLFAASFKQMQATAKKYKFKLPAFEVPQTIEDVQKWYKAIVNNIKRLKLKNADKVLIELGFKSDKAAIDKQQKDIEAKLKELADRISRTKTAKEFYDKILDLTGDVELAANVSFQLYGSTGEGLKAQVQEQFRQAFSGLEGDFAYFMPEVNEIINREAYEELLDYINLLPESQQKAAEDLVKAQQQMSAKQYKQWLKDLQKAKDIADKRIELSRYTENQIAAIEERIAKLDPAASDYEHQKADLEKLIAGYKSREDKEAAKIEYDMFKDMPIYVQMFDNLDNASSTMLNNMKRLLEQNKAKWGEFLDPTQLKEMQSRMNEIDKQLAARNPFKTLSKSLKDWRKLRKSGHTREGDEKAAADAINAEAEALKRWVEADKKYQAQLKLHNNNTEDKDVKDAKEKADAAEREYKETKETSDNAQEQAGKWKDIADGIDNANEKIDEYQEQINKALDEVLSMMEALGVDATDMKFFNSLKDGFNQILDGAQSATTAYAKFVTGDIFGGVMSSISAFTGIVSGISNLFTAGKVRRANKEIERQQKLLDQLEYTYSRLEKEVDKLFGRDYVNNYKQQLQNLQAQARAYQKQYEAEKSKGKKADKDALEEYKNAYRDTMDEIADMQNELAEHFTGSSKNDVAKNMAQSWLEARTSMSDTFAAIKSDYQDMIKNMIVEGAAARVIENALSPMWEKMDEMLKDNDIDGAINSLINGMDSALSQANNGMEVLWEKLEAKGYDLKELLGDTDDSEYSGIAKNISNATSEEINNLAAIGNTLFYYVSPIPRIDENLARILAIMQGGGASTGAMATSAGWTDWQQQAMDNYMAIQRNTADTVVECRRAADACEKMTRLIKTKGSTSGFNVFLN